MRMCEHESVYECEGVSLLLVLSCDFPGEKLLSTGGVPWANSVDPGTYTA